MFLFVCLTLFVWLIGFVCLIVLFVWVGREDCDFGGCLVMWLCFVVFLFVLVVWLVWFVVWCFCWVGLGLVFVGLGLDCVVC